MISCTAEARPPDAGLNRRLSARFDPAEQSDGDILTCDIYRHVARDLARFILEAASPEVAEGSLVPVFADAALEHYSLEGRFDRAECRLELSGDAPAHFFLHTSFYLGDTRVTVAALQGALRRAWTTLV